ncbi:D-alanyl-D-alanine carboxypeptidase family protein [Coralliovum pocilloporae]|uniref:D-alanyl-D-alanine carboxypeptidase family protein n=1 Tax=Coralliovum pocilloporae TaxID=3066369 RepID=UPI003307B6CA
MLVAAAIVMMSATLALSQTFSTRAKHAFLYDVDTGTALFTKDADAPMPPASMAKLMTVAVVFDMLKKGELTLDDEFLISENAWRRGGASSGGSTMFAKLDSSVRLEDLLRGIIVQSGNDACIAVAEGISGSEWSFADRMNELAKEIGMTGSQFQNSTGLPDPAQYVTARDLATLAEYLIREHPDYYNMFGEPEFTWNKIKQYNRNPLLSLGIGADGLKTGFTKESGYGLTGSVLRSGQRLILVVNGLKTRKQRAEESQKILTWGFRAFRSITLFEDGETVGEARVFGGDKRKVALRAEGALKLLVPQADRHKLRARITFEGPVPAPVSEGDQIGALKVWTGDKLVQETPLYAAEDIGSGTLSQRALDGLQELLLGWI